MIALFYERSLCFQNRRQCYDFNQVLSAVIAQVGTFSQVSYFKSGGYINTESSFYLCCVMLPAGKHFLCLTNFGKPNLLLCCNCCHLLLSSPLKAAYLLIIPLYIIIHTILQDSFEEVYLLFYFVYQHRSCLANLSHFYFCISDQTKTHIDFLKVPFLNHSCSIARCFSRLILKHIKLHIFYATT